MISMPLPLTRVDAIGGSAPVGAESIVCAPQHRAAICGVLPGEVEVCVVPNAGWKVHLDVCLQDMLQLLCNEWADCLPGPTPSLRTKLRPFSRISSLPDVGEPWT